MDYFSSSTKAGKKPALNKSSAAEKVSISRQSLYYQPVLPAKDLELKSRSKLFYLSTKLTATDASPSLSALIPREFVE